MKNRDCQDRKLIAKRVKTALSHSGAPRENLARIEKLIPEAFFRSINPPMKTLIHQGVQPNKIYYISDGILSLCLETSGKKLYTLSFFSGGQLVFVPFHEIKSDSLHITLQAITECVVWSAEYKVFKDKVVGCNQFYWDYLEMYFLQEFSEIVSMREYLCQTYNAEERYNILLRENKHLIDKVPDRDLASYIGVKPEAFFRLKSKY